jgi:PDZ domain-containing protein
VKRSSKQQSTASSVSSWRLPIWAILVGIIAIVTILAVILASVPSQKVAILPYKPVELNGKLRVDGTSPEPMNGRLFLVGVEERPVNLLQSWLTSFDPTATLVPKTDARRRELTTEHDKQAIKSSKKVAAAAAFTALGTPPIIRGSGAFVTGTAPGTPGAQFLRVGDRIVRLNGRPVAAAIDVTAEVGRMKPGTEVTLGVRRDARPMLVTLKTIDPAPGDTAHRSRIGVVLNTQDLQIDLPKKVTIATKDVIGESAGLAFAMAIWDSLSAVDLLRGRYVVATGSISLDGTVAPIGAARQKGIAAQDSGADLFIIPVGNTEEVVKAVQDRCEAGTKCTGVLPVSSFAEAVDMLRLSDQEISAKLAN